MFWLPTVLLVAVGALLTANLVMMTRVQRAERARSAALTLRHDELARLLTLYNTRLELASSKKFEKSVTEGGSEPVSVPDYRSLPRRQPETPEILIPIPAEEPTRAPESASEAPLASWADVVALGEARRAQKGAE